VFETSSFEKIKISSNKSFGIVFAVFFILFFLYLYFFYELFFLPLLILSFLIFLFTIVAPNLLSLPNKLWSKLGILIGLIISPLILSLIYIFILLPISLVLKILKKDVLDKKINYNKVSYWKNKSNYFDFNDQF
jgi:hypothetical protein